MSQAILPLVASAKRVTIITDGDMRVMKRNGVGTQAGGHDDREQAMAIGLAARRSSLPTPDPTAPDIQDSFVADIESGETGEVAMGESPTPTPGPSDPVAVPAAPKTPAKRKPVIFQDAAAPPAPELAVAEMERLLEEAAQAEQEQVSATEQQRFQHQQAVQAGDHTAPAETEAPAAPRKRTRERALATTGRPCGRCGGGGQIQGEAGFVGSCPVCHGEGQVKTWDRSLKVR